MKNLLFGIFAHPDDEAFGPAASLYHAAHHDYDVHLILLTDGENGTNPDNEPDLGTLRLQEWKTCGELIGASSQYALHYPDGSLSNNLYHEIAQKILKRITDVIAHHQTPIELTFMTYEKNGITGHLDHIATSFITTYVYLTLRKDPPLDVTIGKLKYYCLPHAMIPQSNTDWLFMQCGTKEKACDEIFDYRDLAEQKLKIMKAHYSQRHDMDAILDTVEQSNHPSSHKDHFCYFKD